MRSNEVPQDNSSTYAGHKKLLYAQNSLGEYIPVQSSGWVVEEAATCDAVAEYEQLAEAARIAVIAGEKSTLFYHMYRARMDLPLLAQVSGLWRWRIKRHFEPRHFKRLPDSLLLRYAGVFDISPTDLKTIPESNS